MDLKKKQYFLLIFIICLLLAGVGVIIWQKVNRGKIITDMKAVPAVVKEETASTGSAGTEEEKKTSEQKKIIIHIAGAVRDSGVYKLNEGARVIDVLKLAGGETKDAALDRINLAAPIFDGEKVFIPYQNSDSDDDNIENIQNQNFIQPDKQDKLHLSTQTVSSSSKINLNQANRSELEQLPGIGPSKAASIIKYREKIGSFSEFEQLLNVSGIGEKTMEKIVVELTLR